MHRITAGRRAVRGISVVLFTAMATVLSSTMTQTQVQYPEAAITNGLITARLYVPDPEKGFYRSTRFDWSGIISALEYQGHRFYGPWFTKSDPTVRDFVYRDPDIVVGPESGAMGPAEEFELPIGYDTASAGGTFLKVGIGLLRRPSDANYNRFATYEIADAGKWTVTKQADAIEFTHLLSDAASGYAYEYKKRVSLTRGRPEMVIAHSLRNTGRLALKTNQYCHNFLVLDGEGPGPGFVVTLPFAVQADRAPDPAMAEIRGQEIHYTAPLTNRDRVSFSIRGFGPDATSYDVQVENRRTGAAVRIKGDQPLASLPLWSIRSNISVEPYININVEPGATMTWNLSYTYSVKGR